jgi:hypothetical protein
MWAAGAFSTLPISRKSVPARLIPAERTSTQMSPPRRSQQPRLSEEVKAALKPHFPDRAPQGLLNRMSQVQPPHTIAEPSYHEQIYWAVKEWLLGEKTEMPLPSSPFAAKPEPQGDAESAPPPQ